MKFLFFLQTNEVKFLIKKKGSKSIIWHWLLKIFDFLVAAVVVHF